MNSKKIETVIFKDNIDLEASIAHTLVDSIHKRNSDAEEVEEEINISQFLNLMKVSCNINDVISLNNNQKVVSNRNLPSSDISKDDSKWKMVDTQLLNDVLGPRYTNKVLDPDIGEFSDPSISSHANDRNHTTRRNKSTDGLTISAVSSRYQTNYSRALRTENSQSKLYKKLDYVINEGMVDSVLSFISPIPVPTNFPNFKPKNTRQPAIPKATNLDNFNSQLLNSCTRLTDTESGFPTNAANDTYSDDVRHLLAPRGEKKELEVTIHVCDEVKNITRDFHCPQKLLVDKMGYFAEITAGQTLDEMDISVHCDIQIFDWLIKWMKITDSAESTGCRKSTFKDAESTPHLDANNVIPILVSAGFLQMEPLTIDCLSFCHAHLCEVIRCSSNLSCLNDSVITRLSAMFTNLELEMVRDKKERLTPRLWVKLIRSLCEPEPEALRGHFYSLAGLFHCSKCGEYLTNTIKSYITCEPSNNRLSRWGQLSSNHVRDGLWNMNNYILQIFKERRSWRRVYWKLWGQCHFLYCCICEMHFPVYKMAWCRFHPLSPNYLESIKEDFVPGPVGRYPCCGQKAFRFETIPDATGCHFREHTVIAETDRERQILQIIQMFTDEFMFSEPPIEYITVANIPTSWISIPFAPHQFKEGLLPNINEGDITSKIGKCQVELSFIDDSCSESSGSDSIQKPRRLNGKSKCNAAGQISSDGCESEQGDVETLGPEKQKKKLKLNSGRNWCGELSARSNQDHQREFEEKAIKDITVQINKHKGVEQSLLPNSPLGGFYMRLESEWRDQLKHRSSSINLNSSSTHGTGKPKQK